MIEIAIGSLSDEPEKNHNLRDDEQRNQTRQHDPERADTEIENGECERAVDGVQQIEARHDAETPSAGLCQPAARQPEPHRNERQRRDDCISICQHRCEGRLGDGLTNDLGNHNQPGEPKPCRDHSSLFNRRPSTEPIGVRHERSSRPFGPARVEVRALGA